jgi:hypothetical protein
MQSGTEILKSAKLKEEATSMESGLRIETKNKIQID